MTTRDDSEARIRESVTRLMRVQPPRRDPAAVESPHRLRTFAVALSVLVATSAVLTGGFILLRHPVSGGSPSKPTPAAVTAPTPTTMPTLIPTPTSVSSYLPAAGPSCLPSQLEMRVGRQAGAGGNGITYLIFTDRGEARCVLRGTPRVTLLGSDGRALAVPSIVDTASGMFKTYPNDGVGLIPLADQGTSPGPVPEGGVRGQASLPLQNTHDGCATSVAAAAVDLGGARLTVPLTLIGTTEAGSCQITEVDVNPFQPAEFYP